MHSASAAKLEEANLARFLLVALSLMLLLSPLEALAQDETVLPVIVEPTNVYGAYRVGFEGLPVTSLLYLEDLDRALLAGPGYMAALDISSMKVAWTRSLIG
nr:hypothetical protein [Desulfurococcales archaeon]